jgi:hypothetical protein
VTSLAHPGGKVTGLALKSRAVDTEASMPFPVAAEAGRPYSMIRACPRPCPLTSLQVVNEADREGSPQHVGARSICTERSAI